MKCTAAASWTSWKKLAQSLGRWSASPSFFIALFVSQPGRQVGCRTFRTSSPCLASTRSARHILFKLSSRHIGTGGAFRRPAKKSHALLVLPSLKCTLLTFWSASTVCLKYTKLEQHLNEPHKSGTGRFEACDQQFEPLTPCFCRIPSTSGHTSVPSSLPARFYNETGKLLKTL
jgi:hypothetical protein